MRGEPAGDEPDRARRALLLLCAHAGLLVLASAASGAAAAVAAAGGRAWAWDYFRYSYENGWGHGQPYRSDYSLAAVMAYAAAYAAGVAGYAAARGIAPAGWVVLGTLVSALGLASFLVEGSHWVWPHHLSWVASFPAAGVLLALIAAAPLRRAAARGGPPQPTLAPAAAD